MHERTFTGPYLGFPFYSQNLAGRESAYWDTATPVTRGLYRWHIPDPIYFERDLRVEWQQIGTEEAGNFERQDDVATVAYWYQSEPHHRPTGIAMSSPFTCAVNGLATVCYPGFDWTPPHDDSMTAASTVTTPPTQRVLLTH